MVLAAAVLAGGLAAVWVPAAVGQGMVSDATGCADLFGFAQQPMPVVKSADGQTVLASVEWGYHAQAGVCYLILNDSAAQTLRDAAAPAPEVTQPPAPDPDEELECRDPSTIGVLVANGTDVSGVAGRLSGELNAANYVTLQPVNASAQTSSAFYYRAGYEVDARCIANLLGVGAGPFFPMSDPPPGGITLETLGNAYVLILIGPDSLAQRPS